MKGPVRYVLMAIAVIVAVDLAVALLDSIAGGPSGPPLSAFATTPQGVAGYADLLSQYGHRVQEKTAAPFEDLDPAGTVVLLDAPFLPADEIRSLKSFVVAGGTLVAGGEGVEPWLQSLVGGSLDWVLSGPVSSAPLVPAPETRGVSQVTAGGFGAWSHTGDALPLMGQGTELTTLAVRSIGQGRAVVLADASFLENRYLAQDDNATLGLDIAGAADRPVTFIETVHGYGTGLGAIPYRWRWALGISGVGVLLLLVAVGRRLGPPEVADEQPLPPRRAYVEALASAMARSKHADRNPPTTMEET